MSVPHPFPPDRTAPDSSDLGGFGYRQQLRRNVGPFASFAAGFSFVSILTTVFQLFGLGFGFGGAGFFWTWPTVFAGQLLVALCFAELAARYPISGRCSSGPAASRAPTSAGSPVDHGRRPGPHGRHGRHRPAGGCRHLVGFQLVAAAVRTPRPLTATGAQNAVVLGLCCSS